MDRWRNRNAKNVNHTFLWRSKQNQFKNKGQNSVSWKSGFLHLFGRIIEPEANDISTHQSRFSSQIRQTLKKKTFEDAGIPVKQISVQQPQQHQQSQQVVTAQITQFQQIQSSDIIKQEPEEQGLMKKSAEMTLNRLNTIQDTEVDVEGLSSDVKLEFEAAEEVVVWNEFEFSFHWRWKVNKKLKRSKTECE